MIVDGTPYEGKLSRTVWGGGKLGDNIKELPIVKNVYPAELSAGVAYIVRDDCDSYGVKTSRIMHKIAVCCAKSSDRADR